MAADSEDIARVLTLRALRLHGGHGLQGTEKTDFSVGAGRFSTWLLIYIILSLVYLCVQEFNWSLFSAIGSAVFILFFGAFAIYLKSCSARVLYLFFVALWTGAFIWLLVTGNFGAIFAIYLTPVVVVLAVKWGIAALSIAATIPLFVPVAFIIVLAPLLTEDPWRLASEMGGGRIGLLSAISISPLVVFAVRKVVKGSTQEALAHGFNVVNDDKDAHVLAAELAYKVRAPKEVVEKRDLEARFTGAFIRPLEARCVRRIAVVIDKRFRRQALRRLFVLVAGIAIVAFTMIYVLAVSAMPLHLARDWTKRENISFFDLRSLGLDLSLPAGPYFLVALLFATLATVGFLAFASTDDKYADAIIRSVSLVPAERLAYIASVHHHVVGHSDCEEN